MGYCKELNIGNVKLKNNLILAPMAGVTDLPFRKVCEKFNPGLVCLEMVSSKGLFYDDSKTKLLLNTKGEQGPLAFQIFGSDIESMVYATKYLNDNFPVDIIDINMGCPAPKVVKNGDGSKLMLDIEKASAIIENVVNNSKVPVTVKMRKGWDNEHINVVELAKNAEKLGVSAITVHGRTRSEFFAGEVDLDIIKKVKEEVKKIPVIGNGDINSEETALKMFEYTGVDGIMIGRGVFGNPWIFKKIEYFLNTGQKLEEVSNNEKLEIIKEHIKNLVEIKGEKSIIEMRKHLAWYTKGLENSSEFRVKINQIDNIKELVDEINKYFNSL